MARRTTDTSGVGSGFIEGATGARDEVPQRSLGLGRRNRYAVLPTTQTNLSRGDDDYNSVTTRRDQ
jgi:hypothetical protein